MDLFKVIVSALVTGAGCVGVWGALNMRQRVVDNAVVFVLGVGATLAVISYLGL